MSIWGCPQKQLNPYKDLLKVSMKLWLQAATKTGLVSLANFPFITNLQETNVFVFNLFEFLATANFKLLFLLGLLQF